MARNKPATVQRIRIQSFSRMVCQRWRKSVRLRVSQPTLPNEGLGAGVVAASGAPGAAETKGLFIGVRSKNAFAHGDRIAGQDLETTHRSSGTAREPFPIDFYNLIALRAMPADCDSLGGGD